MLKSERNDPDVKCQCTICRGPIYVDEPGRTRCPDCVATMVACHKVLSETVPSKPARCERPLRLSPK